MRELQGNHSIELADDIVLTEGGNLSRRYQPSVHTRGPWEFQSQAVVHSIVGRMKK
jgi:hypothetical protein